MNPNKILCGRGIQYFILALIILFNVLYLVYVNKDDLISNDKYNQVENMLIGSLTISLILILSLFLSYGARQLLYTTILLNGGLMAISIYTLTILSDLPNQTDNMKVVAFSYMATLIGAIGGFMNIASCLLLLNGRC
uniref:Uncharacterized protein n=1 Tax=viral metagenome TaxID=1070528 RepID=A0A6C0E834_9ZZZZ